MAMYALRHEWLNTANTQHIAVLHAPLIRKATIVLTAVVDEPDRIEGYVRAHPLHHSNTLLERQCEY